MSQNGPGSTPPDGVTSLPHEEPATSPASPKSDPSDDAAAALTEKGLTGILADRAANRAEVDNTETDPDNNSATDLPADVVEMLKDQTHVAGSASEGPDANSLTKLGTAFMSASEIIGADLASRTTQIIADFDMKKEAIFLAAGILQAPEAEQAALRSSAIQVATGVMLDDIADLLNEAGLDSAKKILLLEHLKNEGLDGVFILSVSESSEGRGGESGGSSETPAPSALKLSAETAEGSAPSAEGAVGDAKAGTVVEAEGDAGKETGGDGAERVETVADMLTPTRVQRLFEKYGTEATSIEYALTLLLVGEEKKKPLKETRDGLGESGVGMQIKLMAIALKTASPSFRSAEELEEDKRPARFRELLSRPNLLKRLAPQILDLRAKMKHAAPAEPTSGSTD